MSLISYFVYNSNDTDLYGKIRLEIIKHLLQLAVVIIIGGVIAALFKAVEQEREQSRVRAETRADYLKRLGNLYRNVKAARRLLRAGGLTLKYENNSDNIINQNQVKLYENQIEQINEAQLELEGLKIEAKSLPAFVPIGDVHIKLKLMEDYLRKILNESEATQPLLQNGKDIKFCELERLNEFTGTTKGEFEFKDNTESVYRFKTHFSKPYYEVVKSVSTYLLYYNN